MDLKSIIYILGKKIIHGHPVNTGRGTTTVLNLHTSNHQQRHSKETLCLDDEDLCEMGSGAIFSSNSESLRGDLIILDFPQFY